MKNATSSGMIERLYEEIGLTLSNFFPKPLNPKDFISGRNFESVNPNLRVYIANGNGSLQTRIFLGSTPRFVRDSANWKSKEFYSKHIDGLGTEYTIYQRGEELITRLGRENLKYSHLTYNLLNPENSDLVLGFSGISILDLECAIKETFEKSL